MMRFFLAVIACVLLLGAQPAGAQSTDPALLAQQIERQIFAAQRQLDNQPTIAEATLAAATAQHTAQLAPLLPLVPARAAGEALMAAQAAVQTNDGVAFAAARADYRTAVLWGAHDAALVAAQSGDGAATLSWLKLREYKPGSRLNPAAATATLAAQGLVPGELEPASAAATIAADLDETYQALLEGALSATAAAAEREFAERAAQEASLAAGYFRILQADFATKAGAERTSAVTSGFAAMRAAATTSNWPALRAALAATRDGLGNYRAVTLSAEDARQRAGRLQQFIALVPYEYNKGVRNGEVAIPFEIEEARTFLRQSQLLAAELRPSFSDEQAARLDAALHNVEQGIAQVVPPDEIRAQADRATAVVVEVFGVVETSGATFELINQLMAQLKGAIRRGDYAQAETLRVEAYALFEVGPEPKLLGRDPVLATRVESHFWQGDGAQLGLATAIAQQASLEAVTPTLDALRVDLASAEKLLTAEVSLPVAILSSLAIIVREGLEAVLVLGAALAVLRRSQAGRRESVALFGGASVAIALSLVTWVLAQSLLQIGVVERELLEAVMGLLAVVVLIFVTNWLFHKAYVVDWLGYVKQQITQARAKGGLATLGAMALLGFTVVYREGFETVLFYQALLFDAPPQGVLIGFVIGSVLCLAIAYAVLKMSLRLPLKPFFSVTTGLLIVLALMLIGSSARNLQEAGVLPVTPLPIIPAHPLAATFGLYPTVETVAAQLALLLFLTATFTLLRWRGRAHPPLTKPTGSA